MENLNDWKFCSGRDVRIVFEMAIDVKKNRKKYQTALAGRNITLLFQKTSTRTRVSFEAGINELGGHAIVLDWRNTNFTLSDITYEAKYLSRNTAAIMARMYHNRDFLKLMNASDMPVINGCCDLYHPCQALADMMTIYLKKGGFENVKLCYIGVYNNVVNSLVSLAAHLGLHLILVCPIMKEGEVDKESREKLLKQGLLKETLDAKKAVEEADFVYTDTWINMELFNNPEYESEKEQIKKTMLPYQINPALMENSNAFIMHDMPIHPGYEVSEEIPDDPRQIIYDQAENRLDAQKAILMNLIEEI